MSIYLILIGLVVMLLSVVVALIYRSRAEQKTHYAGIMKTIAEAALSQTQHRAALDGALNTLETTQRQETIDETNPKNLARRDGLDNSWSDADRLHDTTAAANHPDSPASTGTTGAGVHFINRPDLSD